MKTKKIIAYLVSFVLVGTASIIFLNPGLLSKSDADFSLSSLVSISAGGGPEVSIHIFAMLNALVIGFAGISLALLTLLQTRTSGTKFAELYWPVRPIYFLLISIFIFFITRFNIFNIGWFSFMIGGLFYMLSGLLFVFGLGGLLEQIFKNEKSA